MQQFDKFLIRTQVITGNGNQLPHAPHYNPRFVYFLPTFWSPKTFFSRSFFLKILVLKFIYSEKATKFCKISTNYLFYVLPVKSKVEILQNFVAISEYLNFKIDYFKFYLIRFICKFCSYVGMCFFLGFDLKIEFVHILKQRNVCQKLMSCIAVTYSKALLTQFTQLYLKLSRTPRAAETCEDMRTGPHYVFRIEGGKKQDCQHSLYI